MKALLPTAVATTLLSKEFPSATLSIDGSLFTVVIYGHSYSDAVFRIRDWMSRTHVGPVLVTDGDTGEDLLDVPVPRRTVRWYHGSPDSLS